MPEMIDGAVMGEMLERVTQAILDKEREGLINVFHARVFAQAAIKAMRDCTPEMLDAGSAAHPVDGYKRGTLLTDIIECEWWAMIDVALKEGN
jgi:hypothetical protein